ncbi:MAG: hypothetical protein BRC32_04620 [Actinobacteria bacterium QS_8_72_14]|nr:MAG: hypothetical protein BRC32_04620 [Actinobacteria bacterium QS_8_72_14]
MARPSVAHRRWRIHRVVLALSVRLAGPSLWVSGTCGVRVAGSITRRVVVATDAAPPVDGVLAASQARLVVQFQDGPAPATWRVAGAEMAWQLHRDRVEIVDEAGTRVVRVPCSLEAPVLAHPMPWPLPAEGQAPPEAGGV